MMISNPNLDILKEVKLGIIGCGHLGQALLKSLMMSGFSKENIYISHRGNPAISK